MIWKDFFKKYREVHVEDIPYKEQQKKASKLYQIYKVKMHNNKKGVKKIDIDSLPEDDKKVDIILGNDVKTTIVEHKEKNPETTEDQILYKFQNGMKISHLMKQYNLSRHKINKIVKKK